MRVTKVINNHTGQLGGEIEVDSLKELERLTRLTSWSPYLFDRIDRKRANGKVYKLHRLKQNFKEAHVIALDIDNGMSLEDAVTALKESGYRGFINTTKSHRIAKKEGDEPTDRFRVVIPLKTPLTTEDQVKQTLKYLTKYFPTIDKACSDVARFFKESKEAIVTIDEGKLLEYTKSLVPLDKNEQITVETFCSNTYEKGNRHGPLVKACYDAGRKKYTMEQFLERIRSSKNNWVNEPKHLNTINNIFENQYWISEERENEGDNFVKVYKLVGNDQSRWTKGWLEHHNVSVLYDGSLIMDGERYTMHDIARIMRIKAAKSNWIISSSLLDDEIEQFCEDMRHKYLVKIKQDLSPFNPAGIAELEKFLKLFCGANYDEMKLHVMRSFIWNVKRRLNGMLTYREIMPIIVGDQGIGKSFNIKNKFLTPLMDLVKSTSFKQLEDSRELKLLNENFVLLFDEMSYANKADVNNIKRFITEQTYALRRMGTTTHSILEKNAQFIGVSNNSLASSIQDSQGMRRFYEINCANRADIGDLEAYYKKFDEIDYDLIWNCADYTKPSPIIPFLPQLEEIQSSFITEDPVEDWVNNSGRVRILPSNQAGSKAYDLLKDFNEYHQGYKYNSTFFGVKLTDRQFSDIVRLRKKDGIYYNLLLTNDVKDF